MIDVDLLRALGAGNSAAELYAPLYEEACPQWGITSGRDVAAFLANCAHESARFSAVEENLNYSANALVRLWPKRVSPWLAQQIARQPEQIANVVYANRMGNGDSASGDGWTYRGRGLIQITGRDNYRALAKAWGANVEISPHLVATPEGAVVSACWFWTSHGCDDLANAGQWDQLRRVVNGGTNGLDDVLRLTDAALNYLGVN